VKCFISAIHCVDKTQKLRSRKIYVTNLHLPALADIRHSERYKAIFVRIVSRNSVKMKATVAVQRKPLEMVYTIYGTNKSFEKD